MAKKKLGTMLNADDLDITKPQGLIEYPKIMKTLDQLKKFVHCQLEYFDIKKADFDPAKSVTLNTTVQGVTTQYLVGKDQLDDHFIPIMIIVPYEITPIAVKHYLVEFYADRKTGRLKNTAGIPDNKVYMKGENGVDNYRAFISGAKYFGIAESKVKQDQVLNVPEKD